MNWFTLFVGLGLVTSNVVAHARSCTLPGAEAISSVVRVSDTDGVTASGVVIGDNMVLTAAHAIEEGATVRIAADGGQIRPATVIAMDYSNDLALLSADTHGIPAVTFGKRALRAGDAVWAAGYPHNKKMHISTGRYRKARGDRLELNAWIDSGHSGGALFNCVNGAHRLAGIVHGYIAKRSGNRYVNTGRSVSISVATVTAFLAQSNLVALAQ